MATEKTTNRSNPDEKRTPEEVSEYNDRVWDMVLKKIHVVALYVLLQIVLISFFQTHPEYRNWSGWVYGGQFLGAWTVFYGTLLRDMGFRSYSGLVLLILSGGSVIAAAASDPLLWSDQAVRILLLVQVVPATVLWLWTICRWRVLKGRYLEAQEKGLIP